MPLSWNEIKDRARAFSKEWEGASDERAQAQSFWIDFFNIFGITPRRVATFEEPVKKLGGQRGFIDLFWKGVLLIEHKSRGKDLDKAFTQALDYFPGIHKRDEPRYVLVSDFARFRLHDLDRGQRYDVDLKDLHRQIRIFGFIAGYQVHTYKDEDPVNREAAERMGKLYDRLKAIGYTGHPLEMYLVRLLFCLFAEDTGIFRERKQFQDYIELKTSEDGSDLAAHIAQAFHVLNTPESQRLKNLDEHLAAFPYVNGNLFEESLPPASFDSKMREALLDCCALDWSKISPAIFGALFQSVMDEKARRNLGAHYTSEKNIQKLIKPLFLDELWAEFEKIKSNRNRLFEFHKKLRTLKFLDPACGCGNFLVITYRELRLLELEVLRAARTGDQRVLDVHGLIQLDVDQFYGIEIEEFPAQIAQVALWLMDHQMNLQVSDEFGMYFARIPLKTTPHIVHGNALRLDWNEVVPREHVSYILGNPPFVGKKEQSLEQKADFDSVVGEVKGSGVLDFVAAWYVKAARFVSAPSPLRGRAGERVTPSFAPTGHLPPQGGRDARVAFVSTNSITQGEQVGVLWPELFRLGMRIHFAHRTFQWRNEARGVAAVHCVIIGFGPEDRPDKVIFDYDDIKGEPHAIHTRRINSYLLDAPDLMLANRRSSVSSAPELSYGSFALDDGHYTLSALDREALLRECPAAAAYIRPFVGGQELIRGESRWCLWLKDTPPAVIRTFTPIRNRVEAVRTWRLASGRKTTRDLAETPALFAEIRQPSTAYLAFPTVSSERRIYIPIGMLPSEVIASNQVYVLAGASLYHLGILTSAMHMAWVRTVCGRLKSDYRYSAGIVYNNFPWPLDATDKQKQAIEEAAQKVLDTRAKFPKSSLADLYDPLTMPPDLLKAHQALDRAVDTAYVSSGGKKNFASDAERVAFLFDLYRQIVGLLPALQAGPRKRKPKNR